MQRPRRTTELHDDPAAPRRQSRQSRIAIRTRSPSTELLNVPCNNAYFNGTASSVTRANTPQKTPLTKSQIVKRDLPTAEKNRVTTHNGGLHNDKKWIQEQTLRITEYLMNIPNLNGISTEFLNRGLRQMSIKQFIYIVNYFLSHIWGTRFTVGNNHVDDITNILQKLSYPHPINKSWLKTPNTQHSFGNIILMLDFLMEFIPTEDKFQIEVATHSEKKLMNAGDTFMLNTELQLEILRNAEDGFQLWDKQLSEKYQKLQQHTCDCYVKNICGVDDTIALDIELNQLKDTLTNLEMHRPDIDDKLLKTENNLNDELKSLRKDLKSFNLDYENNNEELKQWTAEKKLLKESIDNLQKKNNRTYENIKVQVYTVEQRDKQLADLVHVKHVLNIEERTVRDLEARDYNQAVKFVKMQKELTDLIESFNAYLRHSFPEILACQIPDYLKIPLNLEDPSYIEEKILPELQHIKENIQCCHKNHQRRKLEIQPHLQNLQSNIIHNLQLKLKSLNCSYELELKTMQDEEQQQSIELQHLRNAHEIFFWEITSVDKNIDKMNQVLNEKESLLQKMHIENENILSEAENIHGQYLTARKEFLQSYNNIMDEFAESMKMDNIKEQIQRSNNYFNELKKL